MSADFETLLPSLVAAELQKLGISDATLDLRLEPLARDSRRLDHGTRRSFKVLCGAKAVCYLVAGAGIDDIWNRARAFSQECPSLAARPLFMSRSSEGDFLGLEFIEGATLEDAALGGKADLLKLAEAAASVLAALDRTLQPSSEAARQTELEEFLGSVAACPIFGAIDRGFLRDVIFPWIRDAPAFEPAQTRWTNGDLVAHNVVIDGQGNPRLIDYEYAARTHFYAEDFLRWRRYSKALKHAFDPRFEQPPPWLEAFFLLRQTVLEVRIGNPRFAFSGAEERARRLRELAAHAHAGFESSLFLKPLTRLEPELRNLENQMTGAQALAVRLMAELEDGARNAAALDERLTQEQLERAQGQARRAILEDKISRMQNSLSWKLTAPLRAVRRLLFGK
jgi:hypothetical protein